MKDPKLKNIQIEDPNNPILKGSVSKWNLNPFAHLQGLSDKNEAKLEQLQELPKDNFLINSMLGAAELGQPIVHSVAHPIETLKDTNKLVKGLATNTLPTISNIGSQVLNDAINYYGNNLGQHLYEDPMKPIRDLYNTGMLIEGAKMGLTRKIPTKQVLAPSVNIPELQGKSLDQIKSIPSLSGKILDDIVTPKSNYTVSDYTNPATGKTDWRLVDEVFRDATADNNIVTRETKHGSMTDFEGELDPTKTGTGTDSGWNGWGSYTTPDANYARDYVNGIPTRSYLPNIGNLSEKVRGEIADLLYTQNKNPKLSNEDYNDIINKMNYGIQNAEASIATAKEYGNPEKIPQLQKDIEDYKSVINNLKKEADLSIIKPNVRTVEIPDAKYFLDEDTLISKQNPEVQNVAKALYKDRGYTDKEMDKLFNEIRGYDLYRDLSKELGSKQKASQLLDAYGVLGSEHTTPFKENVIYNKKSMKTIKKEYLENLWDQENNK